VIQPEWLPVLGMSFFFEAGLAMRCVIGSGRMKLPFFLVSKSNSRIPAFLKNQLLPPMRLEPASLKAF
jgi:hypothetical protein